MDVTALEWPSVYSPNILINLGFEPGFSTFSMTTRHYLFWVGRVDVWAEADEAWPGMDPQWHDGAELHQDRGAREAGAGEHLCPHKLPPFCLYCHGRVVPEGQGHLGTHRCAGAGVGTAEGTPVCPRMMDTRWVLLSRTASPWIRGVWWNIHPLWARGKMCQSSLSYSLQGWNTELCPRAVKSCFHNTFQWYSAKGREAMSIKIKSQVAPHCEKELLSMRVAEPWNCCPGESGVSLSGGIPNPPRWSWMDCTVSRGPFQSQFFCESVSRVFGPTSECQSCTNLNRDVLPTTGSTQAKTRITCGLKMY